jgi:hypothetical protein
MVHEPSRPQAPGCLSRSSSLKYLADQAPRAHALQALRQLLSGEHPRRLALLMPATTNAIVN